MWWVVIAGAIGYILLGGNDEPQYMPGPLQPGQERPTY